MKLNTWVGYTISKMDLEDGIERRIVSVTNYRLIAVQIYLLHMVFIHIKWMKSIED